MEQKKPYVLPEIEIISFDAEDVITTSDGVRDDKNPDY